MSGSGSLRVAIAGYGLAGEVFHAPLVAATEGLSLVAVTTSDERRAARARAAYHGVAVKPDAETLLRDIPDVHVLVVATPNRLHVPIARAALARGIAVVMDKPLAADAGPAAAARRRVRGRAASRSRSFRTAAGTATS